VTIEKDGLTEQLVDYTLGLTYENLPPEVLDRTKQFFLDFLGVALGGWVFADSSGPILQGVKDLLNGQRGSCTVVGEAERYPAHFAALLNAAFAHSMDFDDTHRAAVMHPGAPIFATLLALAEEYGFSGREFLTAAVAAYDVANKVNRAIGEGVHKRGFHPTATTGIFSATMAGARLLGMSREQVLNAVGLNGSQAAGSQQFLENGAWNKRLHVGLAAHNAIYALVMARRGFKGASHPLEGRFGYFYNYSADGWDPAKITGLGTDFEVMYTAIKPYPCCRFNHGPIDAVLELRREHRFAPHGIAAMDVHCTPLGCDMVGQPEELKRNLTSEVAGQFSVYFATAVAAVDGGYTWQSYDKLQDPTVKTLMEATTCHSSEEMKGMGCRVTITTRNGRTLSKDVPLAKGEPENPLTRDEIEAKFTALAHPALGKEKANDVALRVRALESLEDMYGLAAALRA
jgi:2-methylcitrate dehydratase PrpD